MEYKADTNVVDDKKDTPLLAACRSGHSECLELLFSNSESKPDVNSVDNKDESGAMLASKNGHANCLNILLRNEEIDLTQTNERGENALMLATEWNHIECVKILLEHGVDPNAKNVRMGGRTALHIACTHGHAEIVKLLIDHNANVDSLQLGRLTPLMCAVLKNNVQCVRHLLEANADGNLADNEAVTPAIMASVKGSTESLELLLEAGVDINTCDIYAVNCLTHAIRWKNWKCVDLLVAYGAFVKSIFNVHILCDDPERLAKLTELIYAAGGRNYVGEEDVIAHKKRNDEKKEREEFEKSNVLPLYFLCKEYIKNGFTKKYPGTNLFPLVESLPIPIGFKRTVLNGITLDVKVPLEKAVKCTSYDCRPHICAMCLRSEAELRVENLELELCRCRVVGYCSERCDRNHWVMAHMATCEAGNYTVRNYTIIHKEFVSKSNLPFKVQKFMVNLCLIYPNCEDTHPN